ncbi:MAG: transposase [Rhizobium sp.]|nr:transposase [Rhizobium sp.]
MRKRPQRAEQPGGEIPSTDRRRERLMKRFKSSRQLQRFVSIHDPIANPFDLPRHDIASSHHREFRDAAMRTWHKIAHLQTACIARAWLSNVKFTLLPVLVTLYVSSVFHTTAISSEFLLQIAIFSPFTARFRQSSARLAAFHPVTKACSTFNHRFMINSALWPGFRYAYTRIGSLGHTRRLNPRHGCTKKVRLPA